MNEELVKEKLDIHDKRINDHSGRLDKLEKSEAQMTERIKNLCEKIESQTKTLNALIGVMATGLVAFFFYAIQSGIFK
ncbi:MAG: hemolysin XhlA family protein [Eubacterium sp.]